MLQLLDIPRLSTRRKYLKLTTMYNIVGNNYFPPDIFLYNRAFHTVLTIMLILLDPSPVLSICIHPLSQM